MESFEYEYLISGWELLIVALAALLIVLLSFRFYPSKAAPFKTLDSLKTD